MFNMDRDFSANDAASIINAIVPVITKRVQAGVLSCRQLKPATVISINDSDGTAVVRLMSSPDNTSEDFTVNNESGGHLSVGQSIWIDYWGDITNSYISPMIRTYENIAVPTSSFVPDVTYPNLPYKADITISDTTINSIAIVTYSPEDDISGKYSRTSRTGDGTVTIWAKEVPASNLLIQSIMVFHAL